MESKRQLQTAETIKRHFSMVMQQEGPYIYGRDVLVSITSVKMSSDLGIAKIYLSIFNAINKQEVMIVLEESMHRLRQLLYQRIRKHVRRVPELHIYLDNTLDEMDKLNQLFDELNNTDKPESKESQTRR